MKTFISNLFHYFYFIFFFCFLRKKSKIVITNRDEITSVFGQSEVSIPYKIWIFWYDLDIPELVETCIQNIRDLHPEYQINVLNKDTVSDFVDLNVHVLIKHMPVANLSDLVRLKLLQKYGGIWMDASIILEKNIEEFFLVNHKTFDIIGFYNFHQSLGCKLPVIESWFLAAPPNSNFINKWLGYFEPIAELGSKGLFDTFKKNPDFLELRKGLDNPLYLVVYIAAKLAYRDMKQECNMLFYCCDDSAFAVQIYSEWRTRKCVTNLYIRDQFVFSPIYKLASGDRKYYYFLQKYKLINNRSIVGKFLERMKK